jgi:dTDP-L-rhamnose 4-epimerase
MAQTVLITGGGGFIGSHVADALIGAGYHVRALDNLTPQVHGPDRRRPAYLDPRVDLRVADVRDAAAVRDALKGVDAVVHFAAAVGVGQSMYAIADYTSVNNLGTAVLLEALADSNVGRVVVASSMSVYGEGRYLDAEGRVVDDADRHRAHLESRRWDPMTRAGGALTPIPTPVDKLPALSSV